MGPAGSSDGGGTQGLGSSWEAPGNCEINPAGPEALELANFQASRSRKFASDILFPPRFHNKSPSLRCEQRRLVAAADPLCSDVRIASPPLVQAGLQTAAAL